MIVRTKGGYVLTTKDRRRRLINKVFKSKESAQKKLNQIESAIYVNKNK